jgi:hypothetical protein
VVEGLLTPSAQSAGAPPAGHAMPCVTRPTTGQ